MVSEFISDVSCNEVGVLLLESYRDLLFPAFVISVSAVARPNGQPRQAGVARGVRGHAPPPPPEKF